jgi:hypothetical protein
MATIKKPKITPLSADRRAVVAAVRAAERNGRPVAAAAFRAMSREARADALRSQR